MNSNTFLDTPASSSSSPAKNPPLQKPILAQVYEILLFFCSNLPAPFPDQLGLKMYENLRIISLTALGHVFIAHPKFLLKENSIKLMNQIFADDKAVALKVELLKIFVEFLQSGTKKMAVEAVASKGGEREALSAT